MLQSIEGSPTHRREGQSHTEQLPQGLLHGKQTSTTLESEGSVNSKTRDLYLHQIINNHECQQDNSIHRKSRYNTVMDKQIFGNVLFQL